jgi:ABC-type uncharacterized transport system fused permease/ATPase subunit
MYAYIQIIVLSYGWQVERWLLNSRSNKISKNGICNFLLLFVDVKSGIPQEGHLEPTEMKVYQTFFLQLKQFRLRKQIALILSQICMYIQKQINKSCVIYLCFYHYSIIYELLVYFVSYKYEKMVRNDKTLFVKHSCNINVGTCAIYPLYNSIDKHDKTFFSHSLIVFFIYFWNVICLFCK